MQQSIIGYSNEIKAAPQGDIGAVMCTAQLFTTHKI
jgi:hypothetical protein